MFAYLPRKLREFISPPPSIALGTYELFGWLSAILEKCGIVVPKKWLPIHRLNSHFYIAGKSGKGKSKFILMTWWQLITKGKGCALIDPHADLANELLMMLAHHPAGRSQQPWLHHPENAEKVIFCEPGRRDYVIPWNLFAGEGTPYDIATKVWEAFARTWRNLANAPQSENIAVHSMMLLIEHQLTLVELPRLLLESDFRSRLVEKSNQPRVVKFFKSRFDEWGKQGLSRAEPLLNKVTALTLNDNLRWMLGASDNRLNLRTIMDNGQVLIVNLGWCDKTTRDLMGSLFTVNLEQAAMSRVKLPEKYRRPFYCMIDEFQGFVTNDSEALGHILSESRKAGLRLGMAHQGAYQLSSMMHSVLEQTDLKVIFGTGRETAKRLTPELFTPKVDSKKEGSTSIQKERFTQALQKKPKRRIQVMLPDTNNIITLRTLPVPKLKISADKWNDALDEVKLKILLRWGKPVNEIQKQIDKRDGVNQHRCTVSNSYYQPTQSESSISGLDMGKFAD